MVQQRVRIAARFLLPAALTMVINTACSHAPRPVAVSDDDHAIVTRVLDADNALYVTSRYAVTDSVIVIESILRGDKYYTDADEPHLHGKPESARQPAADLVLPVRIPMARVRSLDPAVVRIQTTDGTLYVTSRYAVTDTSVIISEVIREEKYFPHEARLYGKEDPVKLPPPDAVLPVVIPLEQVVRVDGFQAEDTGGRSRVERLLLLAALVALAIVLVAGWELGGGDWEWD